MLANVETTVENSRGVPRAPTPSRKTGRNRVLVVEDDATLRDVLAPLLEGEGYQVSVAPNGRDALERLHKESPPDVIILDLKMPVMDGWEFRSIQKDDPKLGLIPVVALSADHTPPAVAISAQAYLHKPVDLNDLLTTIERVLRENEPVIVAREDETQRLAALGRLAAGVGHEINNPLSYVMLNLTQSLEMLRPSIEGVGTSLPEARPEQIKAILLDIADMLEDCRTGGERIRETITNLQRLSRRDEAFVGQLDVNQILEQSLSMTWNQIRHRAQLVKRFSDLPLIRGNGVALGQVFLNLLINAAQAIPEGDAEQQEIRIATKLCGGEKDGEVMVEISDTGSGMAPEVMTHIFEPFFTTKAAGVGTGLGLSISHQTVVNHGGRLTVESQPGHGTTFRVFLPVGVPLVAPAHVTALAGPGPLPRGRILVIDDEEMVGRAVARSLKKEHDATVVQRASDAIALFERGETFDVVFCDVVMPDISGPELYATVSRRWPQLAARMVFMTGGAFTPETIDFVEHSSAAILAKPCSATDLSALVRGRLDDKP